MDSRSPKSQRMAVVKIVESANSGVNRIELKMWKEREEKVSQMEPNGLKKIS